MEVAILQFLRKQTMDASMASLERGNRGLVRRRGGVATAAEPFQSPHQRVGVDAAARQARVLTRLPVDCSRERGG